MLMFLVIFFVQLAQAPSGDQLASGAVSGRTITLNKGESVERVALTLRTVSGPSHRYETTSDAGGLFSFQGVAPGLYRLLAKREGFATRYFGARQGDFPVPGSILEIKAGQIIEGLVIKLAQQTAISGRVVDEKNNVAKGAEVQLFQFRYQSGRRQLAAVMRTRTDSHGEYRLQDLRSGRYYVGGSEAIDGDVGSTSGAFGISFYGGTLFVQTATPIDLKTGTVVSNVDLRLAKASTVTITGKVMSTHEKKPDSTVKVVLVPDDVAAFRNPARSVEIGFGEEFVLAGVTPGLYSLIVDATGDNPPLAASMPITVGAEDIRNVRLDLQPAISLPGKVEASREYGTGWNKIQIELRPAEKLFENPIVAEVNDDGSFQLEGLLPIPYQVAIFRLRTANIRAKWADQDDVHRNGIDLSRGATGSPLQIYLGAVPKGQLAGIVRNRAGQPVIGATLTIVSGSTTYAVSKTGIDGEFNVQGIPEGDYRVYAWEEIAFDECGDPDFHRPFENLAEKVTIQDGAVTTVKVNLIPAEAFGQ